MQEAFHVTTGTSASFHSQVVCIASTQSRCLATPVFSLLSLSEVRGLIFYLNLVWRGSLRSSRYPASTFYLLLLLFQAP